MNQMGFNKNQIGFNRKKHSARYLGIINILGNTLRSVFYILVLFALSGGIIYSVFIFPQHKAWLIAEGSPQDITINNFKGRIDCTTNVVASSDRLRGIIINQQPLFLNVYGQDFNLNPGDLKIVYGENRNNRNYLDSFSSDSPIQFEMLDMNSPVISIKREFLTQKFDKTSDSYWLNILGFKDSILTSIYNKKFQITFEGDLDVYIKGQVFKPNTPLFIMNFINPSEKLPALFRFNNIDNMELPFSKDKDSLLLTGECGKSDIFFENGNISFDYTKNEKQYILNQKELLINPFDKENYNLAYSMTKEKQLQIYGYTSNSILSGNSLFPTFKEWLIDNTTTVVGTVIATFLGVIIVKRN